MAWVDLGTVEPVLVWQETSESATDRQNLVGLTYISNGSISEIVSRLLVRRIWQIDGGLPVEEQATIVYPSTNKILLALPNLPDDVDLGLAVFKIQIRRYYRYYRAVIQEPRYYIRVEVAGEQANQPTEQILEVVSQLEDLIGPNF
ncbi:MULTISPECIES: hypothetical protein [unclassified Microcoleus]|uniref:hypothetical protein n=1 Tax=unclassified Microcoleus TaxID=2642155 RepID=UPI002600CAB8|nr:MULTISPECIES: hypothetical protein [unclassified Microcoleus]